MDWAVRVLIALVACVVLYLLAVRVIRTMMMPPPPDEPDLTKLEPVDYRYRCMVCGTEVTMTASTRRGRARRTPPLPRRHAPPRSRRAVLRPSPRRPFVIAVGGIPGAGKTTLARRVAHRLHVPVVVRDEIKEGMHVTAGSDDPAEVHRFAAAAFTVFWSTVHNLVDAGVSLVAEAAFHREHAAVDMQRLRAHADLRLLWCAVDPDVALARYRARAPSRHPAHADAVYAARMAEPAFDRSVYDPPAGPWPLVVADTTGREPAPTLADLCRMLTAPLRTERPGPDR